jgi:hypothetical protein
MQTVFMEKLIQRNWVFAADGWVLREGLGFRENGETIHGTVGWQDHYRVTAEQLIFLGGTVETAWFDLPEDVTAETDLIVLHGIERDPQTGAEKAVRLYSGAGDAREPDWRFGPVTIDNLLDYYWQWEGGQTVFIRDLILQADGSILNGDPDYHARWTFGGQMLRFFGADHTLTAELVADTHNADGIVFRGDVIFRDSGERALRRLVARPFRYIDPAREQHNAPHALMKKDIVLTTFFVDMLDAQRQTVVEGLTGLMAAVTPLAESVQAQGSRLVVISNLPAAEIETDLFDYSYYDAGRFDTSVYWARWMAETDYIRQHEEIGQLFVVDTTDVEMLRNPFGEVDPDTLYVGSQSDQLLEYHVRRSGRDKVWQDWLRKPDQWQRQLLNPGVIGGERAIVLEMISSMVEKWALNWIDAQNGTDRLTGSYEMAYFNLIGYEEFADRLVFGPAVTTHFDAFDVDNQVAWFRHK